MDLDTFKEKTLTSLTKKATDGVLLAHTDGDVPNMYVTLPEQDAFTLGYTIYFFELAIALSGYLNAINPFDQPGVEAYKKNMFALLGKPGFEELGAELNARPLIDRQNDLERGRFFYLLNKFIFLSLRINYKNTI